MADSSDTWLMDTLTSEHLHMQNSSMYMYNVYGAHDLGLYMPLHAANVMLFTVHVLLYTCTVYLVSI